jgi:thioredoxin-related protein
MRETVHIIKSNCQVERKQRLKTPSYLKTFAVIAMLALCGVAYSYFFPVPDTPPGEGLEWRGFSEALSVARLSNKKVLVDVYTTWCGWCKKMDRDVYGDTAIKSYLEQHFILAKLDAESAKKHTFDTTSITERQIAGSFGVTGYPTTIFLNEAGQKITVVPGYIKADVFKDMLAYIYEEAYKTTSWNDFQKAREKRSE